MAQKKIRVKVRANLQNVEIIMWEKELSGFWLICDTDTFTTKACGEAFKIQIEILNCNFQKVVYISKCRICGEAFYVGKAKTKCKARFNNYKSAHRSYKEA